MAIMNCGCSKQINQSPNTVILRRNHAVTEITTPKRKMRGRKFLQRNIYKQENPWTFFFVSKE